ncbi:MAG: hypothetical protein IK105_06290 [Thermoguttaceae bacterium]|nr:hypothetical protein [Thermoguttaceae bacterium]
MSEKSELLKELGWSDDLIRAFLTDPKPYLKNVNSSIEPFDPEPKMETVSSLILNIRHPGPSSIDFVGPK